MSQEQTAILIVGAFAVAFPAFFMTITGLLGMLSGWSSLSRFRSAAPPQLPLFKSNLVSGRIGWVNYNSVLNFSLYPDSLYLWVLFPFRVGHPNLLIPREEIKNCAVTSGWFGLKYLCFQVGNAKFKLLVGNVQKIEEWLKS